MKIVLDRRLRTIFDWACEGRAILEIGADHGRLSAALVECETIERVLATEREESRSRGLRRRLGALNRPEKIEVRVGNGLSVLRRGDSYDTAVLAGMGAESMLAALDQRPTEVHAPERLILQPQGDIGAARRGLSKRRYRIVREQILEIRGWVYEIIEAHLSVEQVCYRHPQLDEDQLFEVGPCLVRRRSELLKRKWQRKTAELQTKLSACEHPSGIPVLQRKHRRCREILSVLETNGPLV